MGAAVKIVLGLVVLAIGLALFADSFMPNLLPGPQVHWFNNLVFLLQGTVPILLVLVGLFILWLEVDELKSQKAFKKESK